MEKYVVHFNHVPGLEIPKPAAIVPIDTASEKDRLFTLEQAFKILRDERVGILENTIPAEPAVEELIFDYGLPVFTKAN